MAKAPANHQAEVEEGFDNLPAPITPGVMEVARRVNAAWQSVPEVNGKALNEQLTMTTLLGSTLEEIFADGPASADDIEGRAFTLNSVTKHGSDFDGGMTGYYLTFDVTMTDTGESLKVNCGADHVVVAVTAMVANVLPKSDDGAPDWSFLADRKFKFQRSRKATAIVTHDDGSRTGGYYPINLVLVRPGRP